MRWRRARPGDPPRPQRSTQGRMLIAAVAGAAGVLSFAPLGWWPLQILSLAVLFYQALRAASVKASAWIGWAFGFGWCLAGVHWLYIVLNRFNNLSAPIAAIAIVLLALFMGGYTALAMGGAAWLRKRWAMPLPAANLLLLPVAWAIGEWLRGWVFTGFPWATAGYAHNVSPLAGYAPLLGVYGISWLAALTAGALLLAMHQSRWIALGLAAATWLAGFALQSLAWTQAAGKPISVRLVQGNIALERKFDPAQLEQTLRSYYRSVTAAPADLIATPETAVPLFQHQLPTGFLDAFGQFARKSGSHVVLGIPVMDSPTNYSNSVLGLAPALGGAPYRYNKHHLVPFGEFIPLGFRWFTDMMQIPLSEQTGGQLLQPAFAVKDQRVLPNICYENAFGEEIAQQLNDAPQPATLLLNVSELGWYGQSVAIPQHLQISQMRSLETGRPMLSATNTGATVVIDSRGQVTHALPYYEAGVLSATVQGMRGSTPYIRLQNRLFLGLAALAVAAAWLWSRQSAKKRLKTA
ncbi:apolipoprotein N-acyltransferase [Massilia sp. YIM B04103]|uniref:apolipoprotein N-acyltransferase n=1 Tax=Massilia sp. YIM B04103 TaxID=2963106 RepID=UPI00210EE285|nr:apolipoprotein N-acyltransferase [Massilia sp. YIM B04103]